MTSATKPTDLITAGRRCTAPVSSADSELANSVAATGSVSADSTRHDVRTDSKDPAVRGRGTLVLVAVAILLAALSGCGSDAAAERDKLPRDVAHGRNTADQVWRLSVDRYESAGTCLNLEPGAGACWGGKVRSIRAIDDEGCPGYFVFGLAPNGTKRVDVRLHDGRVVRAKRYPSPRELESSSQIFIVYTGGDSTARSVEAKGSNGTLIDTYTFRAGHGSTIC